MIITFNVMFVSASIRRNINGSVCLYFLSVLILLFQKVSKDESTKKFASLDIKFIHVLEEKQLC